MVWSVEDRPYLNSGIWATPAIYEDLVIFPTDQGKVHGIDRITGDIRWTLELSGKAWSSPAIVDGVMVLGDCSGQLRAFDLSDTSIAPPQLWRVRTEGCIEATAVIWEGAVYAGSRDGYLYAFRDFIQ